MPAPSVIGSPTIIQDDGSSGSQSIAIPYGAEWCLFMSADWLSDWVTLDSVTLDGNAFSEIANAGNASSETARIWMYEIPIAMQGQTKTLAWSFDNVPLEGANIFVVWLANALYVDGYGTAFTTGSGSITTNAFNSTDESLVLCVVASYGSTDADAAPSGSGQTEISDSSEYNQDQGAVGRKSGTNGTVTMQGSGDYAAMVAVSVHGGSYPYEESLTPRTAALGIDFTSFSVTTGSNVPPLGEGDTPGFVLFMLSHSYYQQLTALGLGEGLEEPGGDNAATWGAIFFGS